MRGQQGINAQASMRSREGGEGVGRRTRYLLQGQGRLNGGYRLAIGFGLPVDWAEIEAPKAAELQHLLWQAHQAPVAPVDSVKANETQLRLA